MKSVRILHLEDVVADAELIQRALVDGAIVAEVSRVDTRVAFVTALERGGFDVILADYNLPSFDGMAALELAREKAPDIPFIFVSGLLGEEVALESLKNGATDYVFKHHLERLSPAINRAIKEAAVRAERKRSEEARFESEATLRSFFDTAPFLMGIVEVVGDEVRHISDNLASAHFCSSNPEAKLKQGANASETARPIIGEWIDHFRETRQTHHPVQFEHTFVVEKKLRWLSVTVSELPSASAAHPRFCYVAEDTTARRQLEQQFLRAQRMESIGRLAGGIAHDLNNVLAPIIMSLKLLRPRLSDPDDQRLLHNLESSARRGADIVKQVLTFARGVEGERRPVPLAPLIGELEMACDTFPRGIQVATQISRDLWKVVGDATQIYQVLMNLAVNARDAMPEGGRLVFAAENVLLSEPRERLHPEARPGPYVTLTVSDTGTGIPPETLDKIFDPFFTTKEIGQGTGLGLSTVLSIVKGHHGFLNVSSEVGRGTEMKIFLPAEKAGAAISLPASKGCVPRGDGELILVVDDESTIRLVTKATLEGHGYRVLTACDGAEAVALYTRRHAEIGAVITDMMMPVMDGAATILALQRINPRVKVISVSGVVDGRHREGDSTERVAVIHKPFSADELLSTLAGVLREDETPRLL